MSSEPRTLTAMVEEEGLIRTAVLQQQPDGQYVEVSAGPVQIKRQSFQPAKPAPEAQLPN